MAGKRVISDYVDDFALAYAEKLAMQDKDEVERLKHCVSELSFRRYIEAYRSGEDHAVCRTTRIGSSILDYLAIPSA